jgi:hypothetical protein
MMGWTGMTLASTLLPVILPTTGLAGDLRAQHVLLISIAIGGYTDPFATPSTNLANAIAFVDTSIGQMVAALNQHGLGRRPWSSSAPSMASRPSIAANAPPSMMVT